MGKNNKERRAAKKRKQQAFRRSQAGAGTGRGGRFGGFREPPPSLEDAIRAAVWMYDRDYEAFLVQVGEIFASLEQAEPLVAVMTASRVDTLWDDGWTPADVAHVVGRQQSATHVAALTAAVVADSHRQAADGLSVHPRWAEQVDRLQRERGQSFWPTQDLVTDIETLALLVRLLPITPTIPRPAAGARFDLDGNAGLDERMLARVRALLAKAESTEFDEEAEAFTAKAQELIARYAIADALLHTDSDTSRPTARRILIDDPYLDGKSALVSAVSRANRCTTVSMPDYGWVTVFGFSHDLHATELLSASLLVQAVASMARHGSTQDSYGRSTTRSFRRSFLYGFADRIGERLQQATHDEMTAHASDSAQALPVLSARADRVTEAMTAAFPHLRQHRTSISNPVGYRSGKVAADLADLNVAAGTLRGEGR